MTSSRLICACGLFLCWLSPLVAAELSIPADTAYLEPDVDGAHFSREKGITGWNDSANKVLWFGELKQPGKLKAVVTLNLKQAATSKLRLTVAGQTHEVSATGAGPAAVTRADFGEFDIAIPGYQHAMPDPQ